MPQVIGNGAVDLLESQSGKIVSDRFCGVAAEKAVDDRIQGDVRYGGFNANRGAVAASFVQLAFGPLDNRQFRTD